MFDVGGYVQLVTAVSAKSNLTIAGQTAPGGGIGFQGGEISFASPSNIIIRHIRIRPGSDTASTDDDALSLYRAHDVIIDHASLRVRAVERHRRRQRRLAELPGHQHHLPGLADRRSRPGSSSAPTPSPCPAHWSWYRNVFANSHNRNPLAKVNTVFVNNVLYNCSAGLHDAHEHQLPHDIVNNYFIFGPASTGSDDTWFQIDMNQSIYYAGDLKDTNLDGTLNGTTTTPYWYQGTGTVLAAPGRRETTACRRSTPPRRRGPRCPRPGRCRATRWTS